MMKNNRLILIENFFDTRGLFTPKCRSPPFLYSKTKIREHKKEGYTMDKKEYYLYVKGKAVSVSEEVYKVYWKIT